MNLTKGRLEFHGCCAVRIRLVCIFSLAEYVRGFVLCWQYLFNESSKVAGLDWKDHGCHVVQLEYRCALG